MADRHELGVPRRYREIFYGEDVPRRVEDLSWAVNDIRNSLAVSMPELSYAPAHAERQAQSTLTAMNTPRAESWLTAATARGADGSSVPSSHIEAYPTMPVLNPQLRPVGFDGVPAGGSVEALGAVTGTSSTEARTMEANTAVDRLDGVQTPAAAVGQVSDSLEYEARRLIDEAFGPQENQREFA